MKTKERKVSNVGNIVKEFAIAYLVCLYVLLIISNAFIHVDINGFFDVWIIRAIMLFVSAVIISKIILKILLNKKYILSKVFKDNLKFTLNCVQIGAIILVLIYGVYSVNSNMKKAEETIKKDYIYQMAVSLGYEDEIEEEAEQALEQIRSKSIRGWVITAAGLAAGTVIAIIRNKKDIDSWLVEEIEDDGNKEEKNIEAMNVESTER